MQLKKLTPEMVVNDVGETVGYYEHVFGFKITNRVENNWASMEWGGIEVMFIFKESVLEDVPEFKDKNIGGSTILFLEINGIKELYEKVRKTEKIIRELHTTFYGTAEFVMKDMNGYTLMFAERK